MRGPPQRSQAAGACFSPRVEPASERLPEDMRSSSMPQSRKAPPRREIGAHGAATHETRAQASRALAREEEAREDEEAPRAPPPRAARARARRVRALPRLGALGRLERRLRG